MINKSLESSRDFFIIFIREGEGCIGICDVVLGAQYVSCSKRKFKERLPTFFVRHFGVNADAVINFFKSNPGKGAPNSMKYWTALLPGSAKTEGNLCPSILLGFNSVLDVFQGRAKEESGTSGKQRRRS